MTQILSHNCEMVGWWVFLHNILYTCIASLDVDTMCVIYCTLLYDHIVINVDAPEGS